MIRAVLDTNVILSALLFGGRLERLHRAWRVGKVAILSPAAFLGVLGEIE